MFAVIKTGGKQYKVAKDDEITIEKLAAEPGDAVAFTEVLMLGGEGAETKVGAPFIEGAAVQAEVVDQTKGEKVIKFVKRRRKHGSARRRGHRQQLTVVRVTDIFASGAAETAAAAGEKKAGAPAAEEAPTDTAAAEPADA